MATNGNAAPVPEYWTVVQVAKYYGVPPWELINRSSYWLNVGIICLNAENELREKERQKQDSKAKRGGRT